MFPPNVKRLSFLLPLVLSVVTGFAAAQNPVRSLPDYWFEDDEWRLEVQYIISAEELSAYHQLKTVEERDRFISQFWARRDPNPGTPQNEFRDEFASRVEYSNAHFADPSNPAHNGMQTDRGRVYVMFGAPDRMDRHPTAAYEIWHYADFTVQFSVPPIDSCDGSYRITSPAPLASFQGALSSVEVYSRRFITAVIPLDFSKTAGFGWVLRTSSGEPVLENEDPILEGEYGGARGEPLSKHLFGCRLFGTGGMAFTHPVPPGSYSFSTAVTLTNGVVQRETVNFEVH